MTSALWAQGMAPSSRQEPYNFLFTLKPLSTSSSTKTHKTNKDTLPCHCPFGLCRALARACAMAILLMPVAILHLAGMMCGSSALDPQTMSPKPTHTAPTPYAIPYDQRDTAVTLAFRLLFEASNYCLTVT